MSMSFAVLSRLNRSERLSSSSISNWRYGRTPATGTPHSSSSWASPGSRMVRSPRNLLTTTPLIRARSSSSSRATVP